MHLLEKMAVYLLTKHSGPQTLDACCFPRQSVLIQACISLCTLELSVLLAVEANVRIPATIKCAPWPFMTIVQHAYLHRCSPLVRCWPRWLWSWPLPRSLAVVCATWGLAFDCCELMCGLRAVLYWVVGAEADSAMSQAPGMPCKADAIQCRIDLDPLI